MAIGEARLSGHLGRQQAGAGTCWLACALFEYTETTVSVPQHCSFVPVSLSWGPGAGLHLPTVRPSMLETWRFQWSLVSKKTITFSLGGPVARPGGEGGGAARRARGGRGGGRGRGGDD